MPNPAGSGLPHPASYDTSVSGMVLDNVTGLLWQRAASAATHSRTDALSSCAGLSLAGHDDWRLPTEIELYSLVDFTGVPPAPAIDGAAFPATAAAFFWASTPRIGSALQGWGVDFLGGTPATYDVSTLGQVRCVQGALPPAITSGDHYAIDSSAPNVTATDLLTHLAWQRAALQSFSATVATSYCDALSPGGTWRVPSVKELMTLVDFTADPGPGWMTDASVFSRPEALPSPVVYGSSSAQAGHASQRWSVDLASGGVGAVALTASERVRCVQ